MVFLVINSFLKQYRLFLSKILYLHLQKTNIHKAVTRVTILRLSCHIVLSPSFSLEVHSSPWMLLEPCCLKEQFCVLRMKDLEQKDGEAQRSTVRHMLSIKKSAINTRNTAPEQHDSRRGGAGGDWKRMEERKMGFKGVKRAKKDGRKQGERMHRR